MARRDKYGHLLPLSKTQCLSNEATEVSFAIPRQSSLVACEDRHGHPFFSFIASKAPRLLLKGFVDWASGQSDGKLARMK